MTTDDEATTLLLDGPAEAPLRVLLAHGAGAPMDTPFMTAIAEGLAAAGWRVIRFEFPYMAKRRRTGRRSGPNGQAKLHASFRAQIAAHGPAARLVLAGKSMGGRMASHLADEVGAAGLICLGYPFHPPGKPEKLRTAHLAGLRTPTLILQGERDPFGTPGEVATYPLSEAIRVSWVADGDHSLKPRKRSGHTLEGNLAAAVAEADAFLRGLSGEGAHPSQRSPSGMGV